MAKKNLLVTGFDPFGDQKINPSQLAVSLLPDVIGQYRIHKLILPTVYGTAAETAYKKALEIDAKGIVCIGQAGGRPHITPELVGVNIRESAVPDNEGNVFSGQPVSETGPAAYFSTLPVRRMVDAIKKEGIPARLSYSAGAFVCNDLLYTLLDRFSETDTGVCFIHVPFLPEQTESGKPSLAVEDILKGIIAAIKQI